MSKGQTMNTNSTARRLVPLAAALLLLAACAPKGEALYARAEKALAEGQPRAAVIDLKNLVEAEPKNGKARALLGQALVAAGDLQGGAIEIQKAKDLGAPKDMIIVPECQVLLAKGEFDKVVSQCQPDAVPAAAKVSMQVAQGRALLGLDRAAESKTWFEQALKARPDSFDALLGLAAATYEVDGLPAAREVLNRASDSMKQRSAYWMSVGGIDTEAGDFAGAEKAFGNAIEKADKNPDNPERLMAMGALAEAQMRQGKIKEATATSDKLIAAAPSNPLVKQLRGQVAAAGGDLDKARTLLEEAVAAMPDNYQARTLLGMVNLQQGNLGQAEMHFAAVVANQPKNVQAQRMLAETRARSQTPEETLESMKPALDQGADPAMLAMAGRLSLASGNREQGLAYLAQASAQASEQQTPGVQFEVASTYLLAGDFDKAIETLQSMPEGGATGYQREYLLLLALLRKGDKEKAVAEANALLARSGNDPQVRNLVAGVLAAAGKPDAGREQFNEALKLKPNDPQTLLNLARLDLFEGKTADAEANFKKVLEADPKNLMAEMGLAVTARARGDKAEAEKRLQKAVSDHPESVDAQLALVQYYIGERDFGKASGVLDAAEKASPGNAALANARGLVLLGRKDLPGATASFKKAAEQAPKAYDYALNLAKAHIVNQDMKSALEVLDGILKAQPQFMPALALAAATSLKAGDVERASGYAARLSSAAPDSPVTLSAEGDVAMAQKRYPAALEAYRKAGAGGTVRELALAQYQAGVLAGVAQPEKPLEDWVQAHPEDTVAVALLAERRQAKGDAKGAIELYERALAKAPGNAVTLNNLAVLYQATGDPRALETAQKAFDAAPDSAGIKDTYGWLLLENGNTEKAVQLLGEAYKGVPDNAEVQYHYAAALAKAGRKDEALPILKKALSGQLPPAAKADAGKLMNTLAK